MENFIRQVGGDCWAESASGTRRVLPSRQSRKAAAKVESTNREKLSQEKEITRKKLIRNHKFLNLPKKIHNRAKVKQKFLIVPKVEGEI